MISNESFAAFPLLILFSAAVCAQNDTEELIDLCVDSDDLNNYTTSINDDCGCTKPNLCVRKCCKPGFYHYHDEDPHVGKFISVCTRMRNSNYENFTVPVFDGLREAFRLKDKFIIGMLNCGNPQWQYFKMNNYDPKERVYIQKNGSLYFPEVNKIYSTDRYCVDEEDGLTFYLCYTPERKSKVVSRLLTSTGTIDEV